MIIAVDMDGVLVDFNRKLVEYMNERGYPDLTYQGITTFYYEELLGPEGGKLAHDWIDRDEVYDGLEPEDGALEGIERLHEFARVVIVTSALPSMANAKQRWLREHGFQHKDWVLARDKNLVEADLLIDDAVHNVEAWIKTGRPAILYDRPWNRSWEREDLVPRARAWLYPTGDSVVDLAEEQVERKQSDLVTVLDEAARLVDRGQRQQDYGPPHENYENLANMVNALFGRKLREPVDAMDCVRFLAAMKLVRDAARPKRDNWVDLAGYARVGERVAAAHGLFKAVP